MAKTIKEQIARSKKYNIPLNLLGLFGLSYREETSLNLISPDVFLIVLYCKLGDYDEALFNIDDFLKNHSHRDKKSADAFDCLREMIVFLKNGNSLSKTREILAPKYSLDIISENALLIDEKYPLSKIFQIPNPKDCNECNVCYFKELQNLADKLGEKMTDFNFDQSQLKKILTP